MQKDPIPCYNSCVANHKTIGVCRGGEAHLCSLFLRLLFRPDLVDGETYTLRYYPADVFSLQFAVDYPVQGCPVDTSALGKVIGLFAGYEHYCASDLYWSHDKTLKVEITTAIIAATAALSGVLLSQALSLLQTFLDRKHQRQKLLRQKYEEMTFLVQESLQYYNELNTTREYEQILSQPSNPRSQRARVLALLYFPQLEKELTSYILAEVAFYKLIVSNFDYSNPANAGSQARVKDPENLSAAEQNIFQAKNTLLEALTKNARRYARA